MPGATCSRGSKDRRPRRVDLDAVGPHRTASAAVSSKWLSSDRIVVNGLKDAIVGAEAKSGENALERVHRRGDLIGLRLRVVHHDEPGVPLEPFDELDATDDRRAVDERDGPVAGLEEHKAVPVIDEMELVPRRSERFVPRDPARTVVGADEQPIVTQEMQHRRRVVAHAELEDRSLAGRSRDGRRQHGKVRAGSLDALGGQGAGRHDLLRWNAGDAIARTGQRSAEGPAQESHVGAATILRSRRLGRQGKAAPRPRFMRVRPGCGLEPTVATSLEVPHAWLISRANRDRYARFWHP